MQVQWITDIFLQVHLAPDHLPILFWKHAKIFSRFMLWSRVFHKKLPLKDIESRPEFIVLIGESLHKFCILRLEIKCFLS